MSTRIQKVSFLVGLFFVALGVTGHMFGSKAMTVEALFTLFKVNMAHNGLHLATGICGVIAAFREKWAESFAQIAGVIYLVIALLALFAPTGFGKVPIGGHNIWLHAVLALTLLFFAYGIEAPEDPLGDI